MKMHRISQLILLCATVMIADAARCNPDGSCTCSGTINGLSGSEMSREYRMNLLREIYSNCTKVLGNLELTRIDREMLAGLGPNPFEFLKHIQEIHGYLLIAHTQLTTVSLPRLRVIWGDELLPTFESVNGRSVFVIFNNPQLEHVNLASLRSIHKGEVDILYNPSLCHWQNVDWSQVLGENWGRRLNTREIEIENTTVPRSAANYWSCNGTESYNCSTSCVDGQCWGPLPSHCQLIYKHQCAPNCEPGMCYRVNDSSACCHYSCAVGCKGPLNTDCMGCKALNNDGMCVDYCPRPTIYDSENKTINNPNARYAYGRDCVQQCPDYMDIFDGCCVKGCPSGMFSTPEDRNCRPCVGVCPKSKNAFRGIVFFNLVCYIENPLSSINIDKFINCTIVQGKVIIRRDLLIGGFTFNEATHEIEKIEAITPEDLIKLKNIKRITDYLFVQSMDTLANLGFLSNLEMIEGQNLLLHRYALDISANEVMTELGLSNLRQVNNGEVHIVGNNNLCYVDSLPWDQIVLGGFYRIENKPQHLCFSQGHRCHFECEDGCWGPGNAECFNCKHYKLDNQCLHCLTNCHHVRRVPFIPL